MMLNRGIYFLWKFRNKVPLTEITNSTFNKLPSTSAQITAIPA